MPEFTKSDYENVEGEFHDGLGTFAEIRLANAVITQAGLSQTLFDEAPSRLKMLAAIDRLPNDHRMKAELAVEITRIEAAAAQAATILLEQARAPLTRVRHTAQEYAGGNAADIVFEFADRPNEPISVKTDKSNKIAVADGQTPLIFEKWAARFFQLTESERDQILAALGATSIEALKANYLEVAAFVQAVILLKLRVQGDRPGDLRDARPTDLDAVKHLLKQLLAYTHGKDASRVVILSRSTGEVTWETVLDTVDVDTLTLDRVSFRPSVAKPGYAQSSEYALKVDGQAVVTFQIKHRRGGSFTPEQRRRFTDITTRVMTK